MLISIKNVARLVDIMITPICFLNMTQAFAPTFHESTGTETGSVVVSLQTIDEHNALNSLVSALNAKADEKGLVISRHELGVYEDVADSFGSTTNVQSSGHRLAINESEVLICNNL